MVTNHIEQLRRFDKLTATERTQLLKELRKVRLLTSGESNSKTKRGEGYDNHILHLAPSTLSGYNMCPKASKGCAAACLNTAGRGRFDNVQNSRIRKTLYFVKARQDFMAHLTRELERIALRPNAVVRLNGTSDIPWERFDVIQRFPSIQFYDYTKIASRMNKPLPSNYHLTFSAAESNDKDVVQVLVDGANVAVVFNQLPTSYLGHKVINGDVDDFRFNDPKNVIVGLTAKGRAKQDQSGFVKHVEVA